jgi:hypothetical protein
MMDIWADEMDGEHYYKRRGDPPGTYFTLHLWRLETLVKKMMNRKGGQTSNDIFWLAKVRREPDLIPAHHHTRFFDSDGGRQESRRMVLLQPTMELQRVKQPPPYPKRKLNIGQSYA